MKRVHFSCSFWQPLMFPHNQVNSQIIILQIFSVGLCIFKKQQHINPSIQFLHWRAPPATYCFCLESQVQGSSSRETQAFLSWFGASQRQAMGHWEAGHWTAWTPYSTFQPDMPYVAGHALPGLDLFVALQANSLLRLLWGALTVEDATGVVEGAIFVILCNCCISSSHSVLFQLKVGFSFGINCF